MIYNIYTVLLSENDVLTLRKQDELLRENFSKKIRQLKFTDKIKNLLLKRFNINIQQLKELFSKFNIKIKDFLSYVAKNIKKIKSIKIINVNKLKSLYYAKLNKLKEEIIFKNETLNFSLYNLLIENNSQSLSDKEVLRFKEEVFFDEQQAQDIMLNMSEENMKKFKKEVDKLLDEDKDFIFANGFLSKIANNTLLKKATSIICLFTMTSLLVTKHMNKPDTQENKPSIIFSSDMSGNIENIPQSSLQDINTQDLDDQEIDNKPIEVDLSNYSYLNSHSESEYLKFILTKTPTQFMDKGHIDKLISEINATGKNKTKQSKIDNILYLISGGQPDFETIKKLVKENSTDDSADFHDFQAKVISESFTHNTTSAFVLTDTFKNNNIVFIDTDTIFTKGNNVEDDIHELQETLEHEIGHINSKLNIKPLEVISGINTRKIKNLDFYSFVFVLLDSELSSKEGYKRLFTDDSQLELTKKYFGEDSDVYKSLANKDYKSLFYKLLSKNKKMKPELENYIFTSIKILLASNLINIYDENGNQTTLNNKNIEKIKIVPLQKNDLTEISSFIAPQASEGYFFNEEERSENITSYLKHVNINSLEEFSKLFTAKNGIIETSINNGTPIKLESLKQFFNKKNIDIKEKHIFRIMLCAGFSYENNTFTPFSSIKPDYVSLHKSFFDVTKTQIINNTEKILSHHAKHNQHESYNTLLLNIYKRILKEST